METISVDWTLLMGVNIGETGLKERDIRSLEPKMKAAVESVMSAVDDNTLGFWDLPQDSIHLSEVKRVCDDLTFTPTDVLVLGIGGSSLGPRTLTDYATMTGHEVSARIHYLDNADPTSLRRVLNGLPAESTLVLVTSKSGSTVETLSAFLVARQWMQDALGQTETGNHFVFITDPENGFLRELGTRENVPMLNVPQNVGGRFSVFTAVGLLPAFLSGVPCEELLAGAAQMAERCRVNRVEENPAAMVAGLHYLLDQNAGRNQSVLMPYTDSLRTLGDWFVQLWGESLGKPGPEEPLGPTPLRAVGSTDQHSLLQLLMEGPDNKAVWFVQIDRHRDSVELPDLFPDAPAVAYLGGKTMESLLHAERRATALALANEGRPSATIHFPDESVAHLGALMFLFEAATAFAGELYGINAFDQPGVEAGKILTNALMGREGFDEARATLEQTEAKLTSFLTK